MEMTQQEVFDKVATHLLKQNARSVVPESAFDSGERCMYRGDEGRMCAAGCLILDQHYTTDLEAKTSISTDVRNALIASGVPAGATGLVSELQRLHDDFSPEEWPERLAANAAEFGLIFNLPGVPT